MERALLILSWLTIVVVPVALLVAYAYGANFAYAAFPALGAWREPILMAPIVALGIWIVFRKTDS